MASITMVRSVVLMAILAIVYGRKGKFTIVTNLEKLFYMELEVMSLADTFLREEYYAHAGDDVHDLGTIQQMMTDVKELHRNVTSVDEYIAHPINVYHLARRLQSEWKPVMTTMFDSEPCKKWDMPEMLKRMKNIRENFPSKKDVKLVAESIAVLQYTEGWDVKDMFDGVISGHRSAEPVTMKDLMDFAWAAYDAGQYYFTTKVSERIQKECEASQRETGCDDIKLLKIASASYFKINKLQEAVAVCDKILKIDPEDGSAKRNKKYYESKLKSKNYKPGQLLFDKPNIKYYQTCKGERTMTPAEASRLYCVHIPHFGAFRFDRIEYYNIDPPIFEIHGAFEKRKTTIMKSAAAAVFDREAIKENYKVPDYKQKPPPTTIYRTFQNRFINLTRPLKGPLDIGTVEVRQFGIEGMYFKPVDRNTIPNLGGHVGSFFTFINDNYSGGHFVFPKHKINITPVRGNTIFFMATKSTLNICPVSYGSQWLAVQSLFELPKKGFSRVHDEDLWQQ